MTLIIAHGPLVAGVMSNHNVKMPFANLLNPVKLGAMRNFAAGLGPSNAQTSTSAPAPSTPDTGLGNYVPLGAQAPTEDAGPPPPYPMDQPLRVYPDEGIPAEVDIQLRELSRQMNIPYPQLRDQFLLETAQARYAENNKVVQPGALGTPISK